MELCDTIEEQEQQKNNESSLHTYTDICGHEGPFKPSDPQYKGSRYNIKIKWNDGSTSMEPLAIFIKDDPITCAIYAKEHGLLNKPGWKLLHPFVRRHANYIRAAVTTPTTNMREANKVYRGNMPTYKFCLLYTSPSPRDLSTSRMPSSA